MARPFLTARWTNLAIVTYAVPPSLLEPRLPPGLELDTRDGEAFVSLVAFDFCDTRVFGCRWPGYCNFPELNLRYYVRCGADRGVMFIREFVRQRLICWVANVWYCENYRAAPTVSTVRDEPERVTMELRLTYGGEGHGLAVTGRKPAVVPPENSVEHFFKEQRYGYGVDRRGRAVRYEVRHPVWKTYPVESYQVEFDWGLVYGPEWKLLHSRLPCSVLLAAGSEVVVFPKSLCQAAHGNHVYPSICRKTIG